jgi:hypothetical protein
MRTGLDWEQHQTERREKGRPGLRNDASRRRWLARGAQEPGRAGGALAAVLYVRLLLGSRDGGNEERVRCGWGSGRAADCLYSVLQDGLNQAHLRSSI